MCSLEGCLRERYCRGWCERHYNQWRKYGTPFGRSLEKHECVECGLTVTRSGPTGQWPHRCPPCRRAHEGPLREARRREYKRQQAAAWYAKNRAAVSERDRLKRQANPDMYSARHAEYNRRNADSNRSRVRTWQAANPDRVKDSRTRRKARKRGNATEPYQRLAIFERDQWVCALCGQPIDAVLTYPDPMCPSIDHVVPLAAGGADAPGNIQASHLICNLRKGARLPA